MNTFQLFFVTVNGRNWTNKPLTWGAADAKRTELLRYFPPGVIHLEPITVVKDK